MVKTVNSKRAATTHARHCATAGPSSHSRKLSGTPPFLSGVTNRNQYFIPALRISIMRLIRGAHSHHEISRRKAEALVRFQGWKNGKAEPVEGLAARADCQRVARQKNKIKSLLNLRGCPVTRKALSCGILRELRAPGARLIPPLRAFKSPSLNC